MAERRVADREHSVNRHALSLPISYLWLRRGLEPAIGFHVGTDFARFAAAYFVLQDWLPG